jgi:hypothetical protein
MAQVGPNVAPPLFRGFGFQVGQRGETVIEFCQKANRKLIDN